MKTLIIALNSQYIHSSTAPWYLKAYCGEECGEIKIMQFTVNDDPDRVLASIYRESADIAAFSCYIWNLDYVLRLADNLHKIAPDIVIILGGPEVSYDSVEIMQLNHSIDFIISGEGERTFCRLVKYLSSDTGNAGDIGGLTYRNYLNTSSETGIFNGITGRKRPGLCNNGIEQTPPAPLIENLDEIPSPYSVEMLLSLENKIVYFESSRGCPFSCSYCISSTIEGVRFFSMKRVKAELDILIKAGVKQIKFVDRTFNCNKKRAKEIIKYIIERSMNTGFHFEVAADLFDDELLELLKTAPEGLIQIEAGIQSANLKTLESVRRKSDLAKAFNNIRVLSEARNIHIHLDLIAGLPFEDYESFKSSFNAVHNLMPDKLQLNFLKMLKGSSIRGDSEKHGYKYKEYTPYEILCSNYISYENIIDLKDIEDLTARYYNSGKFSKTIGFIIANYFSSPFAFYSDLARYYRRNGLFDRPIRGRELYTNIMDYIKYSEEISSIDLINELLKFDFLSVDNSGSLPENISRTANPQLKYLSSAFLHNKDNISLYLPEFQGMPVKEIAKKVHVELFRYDILFNGSDTSVDGSDTFVDGSDTCFHRTNNSFGGYDNSLNGFDNSLNGYDNSPGDGSDKTSTQYAKSDICVLFDYSRKSKVTGKYKSYRIDL